MVIKIEIEGLEDLRREFTNLDAKFNEAVEDAISETALVVQGEVIARINQGPATGRTYQKYNPRRTHQASAPRQAPQSDTGTLAGSVYLDINPRTATVGSALAYAAALEYGTRRMAPRPVWAPVADEEAPKLRERLISNLGRALR